MKKILLILGMLFGFTTYANAFFLDFEDGTDGNYVNDITGVSFLDFNGYDAIYSDCRTGAYNCYSDDLSYGNGSQLYHHNGNFSIWAGPQADARGLIVDFTNNDGTWFSTGYAAASDFFLEAYFTDGTNDTVIGAANLGSPMGLLTINAAAGTYIDYLVLHDTGNFWIADDMSGDASGVSVPEPSSLLLLGIGLAGLGFARRKRTD